MLAFILRRLLQSVLVMLAVAFVAFILFNFVGDPIAAMVGQEHVVRALVGAIKEDRLSHAFLFCGPRGTGKTSTARILAKMVNCEHGPTAEPCGVCVQCVAIREGSHLDVVEIDHGWCRSIYATDPNGIMVEFCCTTVAFTAADATEAAQILATASPELEAMPEITFYPALVPDGAH